MSRLELVVIHVDSAATIGNVDHTADDAIIYFDEKKYNLLSALPLCEDGSYMPVCSDDGENWVICIAATKDGKAVDLLKFAAGVEKIHKSYGAIKGVRDEAD